MKKKLGLGLLIVVVALGALSVGSVFAADPTPTPTPGQGQNFGSWGCGAFGGGFGMMGIGPGFATNGVTATRVASALGITTDELYADLQKGQTIAQIAQAKGVDLQKVVDTLVAPRIDMLAVMVKYGYLTQDQANSLAKTMQDAVKNSLSNTGASAYGYGPGFGGMMGGFGGGMMGRFGGPRGTVPNGGSNNTPGNGSSYRGYGGMMGGYRF